MYEREREKEGERECMNFGNVITEIPAVRLACPSVCAVCSKWDVLKKKKPVVTIPLPKQGKKKKFCGNALPKQGKEKKKWLSKSKKELEK